MRDVLSSAGLIACCSLTVLVFPNSREEDLFKNIGLEISRLAPRAAGVAQATLGHFMPSSPAREDESRRERRSGARGDCSRALQRSWCAAFELLELVRRLFAGAGDFLSVLHRQLYALLLAALGTKTKTVEMGAARTRNVKRVYMKGKMVIECDGSSSSRPAFDDGGCGDGGDSCRTMAAAGVDEGCSTSSSALIVHPNYRHTLPRKGVDDSRRALQTEGTGSENRTDFLSLIPQEIIVKIFSTAILSHTDMCALAMTSPYISSIAESDEILKQSSHLVSW